MLFVNLVKSSKCEFEIYRMTNLIVLDTLLAMAWKENALGGAAALDGSSSAVSPSSSWKENFLLKKFILKMTF